jgi:hypothetical protein
MSGMFAEVQDLNKVPEQGDLYYRHSINIADQRIHMKLGTKRLYPFLLPVQSNT